MANSGPVFESINITLISFEDKAQPWFYVHSIVLLNLTIDMSMLFSGRWTEVTRRSQHYDADTSNKVDGEENYKLISSQLGLSCLLSVWLTVHVDIRGCAKIYRLSGRFALSVSDWPSSFSSRLQNVHQIALVNIAFDSAANLFLCKWSRKQSSIAMYEAVERGSPNTTDYRVYFSEL